jgi:putative inorganic carbon (HCO3(-)) transporter
LTAVEESAETGTSRQSASLLQSFRDSDAAVFTAMLLALGLYYLVPGLLSAAVGGAAFFVLALMRPNLSLATVPLAAPLFYRQRAFVISADHTLYFSLAEFIIVASVAAWLLSDGWTFLGSNTSSGGPNPLQSLRRLVGDPQSALRNPSVFAAIFLVIGVLWLFVPPGIIRNVALREFRVTVFEPVLYFALILRWARTSADVWRIVGAWLVAGALVGREAVAQYVLGQAALMEGVGRATSVFPSATALGIYLGKALPLSVTLFALLPNTPSWRLWRIACGLFSLVIGLGVLASFARGAWIGVFVALAAVAIIGRHKWMLAALGAAVAAGLALLPFINITRITSAFDFSTEDNTGVARAKIWAAALRIIKDHPVTGIGQDQFLYADPSYGVPQLRFFTVSHPHNWILDFWLRLGLPGLLWLVALLVFFFRHAYLLWARLRGTAAGALVMGLIASMIDFVVHGLLDMAYFTMDSAITFWTVVGLVTVVDRLNPASAETVRP